MTHSGQPGRRTDVALRSGEFTAHTTTNTRFALLNSNGTGERTLIRDGGNPVWSPDSRFIAFIPDRQALNSGVVSIMRPDGRSRKKLFGGRFVQPWHLDWLRQP
jgi:hypothetical protein